MTTKLVKIAEYEIKEVTYTDKVKLSDDLYEMRCDHCDKVIASGLKGDDIEDVEDRYQFWFDVGEYGMKELDFCNPTCAGKHLAKFETERDEDFMFAFHQRTMMSEFKELMRAYLGEQNED